VSLHTYEIKTDVPYPQHIYIQCEQDEADWRIYQLVMAHAGNYFRVPKLCPKRSPVLRVQLPKFTPDRSPVR